MVEVIAVGYLGPDAAIQPHERLLIESGLTNALTGITPSQMERIAPWIWPAALLIGSGMYASRLARILAVRVADKRAADAALPEPPPSPEPARANGRAEEQESPVWAAPVLAPRPF